MFFFDDSEKALRELLEVLSKGIDLLANDNLNANLYDAYEKYVISTVKLVDNAYWKNYTARFEEKNPLNSYPFVNPSIYSQTRIPYEPQPTFAQRTLLGGFGYEHPIGLNSFISNPPPVNYKEKLKVLLQKITTVVKELTME